MNNYWKWAYNLKNYDQEVWVNDVFETKEEAIKEGIKEAKELKNKHIYIGEVVQDIIPTIEVDDVIDNIMNDMYEAYGEVAKGYLDDVKREQVKDLEKKLNVVLQEWLKDSNLEPKFYHIEGIEKIEVK